MPISTTPVFTNIWNGPVMVYLNVSVPVSGRLTLDVNGVPDSATNPNAKWLGETKAGTKFEATQTIQQFTTDEETAPFRTIVTEEKATLSGDFGEVLDFSRLLLLLPGATRATAAGYDQITYGGLVSFSTLSVCAIGPLIADPTKFGVVQIYNAYSSGGLNMTLQRKEPTYSPFKFDAQSLGSRAKGDRLWTFWIQQ